MKYSAKYKNAYSDFMLDSDCVVGSSDFKYKDCSVTILCEGQSLYDAIKDFVEMVDEIIETIDNDEEKNN